MKNRKIIIITIVIFALMVILAIFTFNIEVSKNRKYDDSIYIKWNNKQNVKIKNNNKYNISKKVSRVHSYEQFKFDNMKIYTKDGLCNIEFKITNLKYKNNIDNYVIFINFLDKKGNIIYLFQYNVSNELNINDTKLEKFILNTDVSNSYDYVVEGFRDE